MTSKELYNKYLQSGGEYEFTVDEVQQIETDFFAIFPDDYAYLIYIRDCIQAQYTRGIRCGVCGMTRTQSQHIGYDCTNEC